MKRYLSGFPKVDGAFRRFVWSRLHFPEIELKFLNQLRAGSLDIAIDVGAALGSYSWILSRKSKCVYAFEPGTKHADYLEKSIYLSNINIVRSAVGVDERKVSMYVPNIDEAGLHSATLSSSNPVAQTPSVLTIEVPQTSIDSMFSTAGYKHRRIDLLKVDVEGYELEVLQGATSIISSHHPIIICEIEKRHNPRCEEVFQLLRDLGYQCFAYVGGKYTAFNSAEISTYQSEAALRVRLSRNHHSGRNEYINNFVFQHTLSKVKVVK